MIKILRTSLLLISAFTFTFCIGKTKSETVAALELSHGKSAKPNYNIVFPNDTVNRIDIKINKSNWEKMQADLSGNRSGFSHLMPPNSENNEADSHNRPMRNVADSASHHRSHHRPPEGMPRPEMGNAGNNHPKGERRMGPPPGGPSGGAEYEPNWTYCDIYFNNQQWSKVGIRYKGNSSLRSAHQHGIKKLSFKLDFDEFEDKFPDIKNQRFYGFKQLNLKNNYEDKSFIREKVASDLFADFGLVSPKTSFYQVYVDYGEGAQYFGLYSLVEEVDDTVIEKGFSSEDGNLYKPEGFAASFADGSFRTTDMNKKNGKESKDYSDVQKLNTVLNSSLRTENYELWKTQLSEIFDVPVFLKWLAANTVMQNWDTYGTSIHNYYLYNNPSTNKLVWIPWDNNEAFQKGKMRGALSLNLNEVNESWPLIRYIIDDEEWRKEYRKQIADFSENHFNPETMLAVYNKYQKLIEASVIGTQGEKQHYTFLKSETDFTEAIEFLKQHVIDRKTTVEEFLKEEYSVSLNDF